MCKQVAVCPGDILTTLYIIGLYVYIYIYLYINVVKNITRIFITCTYFCVIKKGR